MRLPKNVGRSPLSINETTYLILARKDERRWLAFAGREASCANKRLQIQMRKGGISRATNAIRPPP